MKLSEAWRRLARKFERKTRDGTTCSWFALCPTLDTMPELKAQRSAMRARIVLDVRGYCGNWCEPAYGDWSGKATLADRIANREARILACLMFAEEAADAERAEARARDEVRRKRNPLYRAFGI